MMGRVRTHYIDVAKGILILFVLMSHFAIALKWVGIDNTHPFFTVWYYPQPAFYPFFMQCFFVISGFCSNDEVAPCVFFNKLLKQLFIPWIFFELFRLAFLLTLGISDSILPYRFTSLWFLNALMFAKIICFVIRRFSKSSTVILMVTIILLTFGVLLNEYKVGNNLFCYQQGLICSFFYSVGYCLKNREILYHYLLRYSGLLYVIIILGRFLHLYDLPGQDDQISVTLSTIPLFLITSLSGSFVFLFLSKRISENLILEYFGRNTLLIYGLHMWLFVVVLRLLYKDIFLSTQLYSIYFILCVYLSLLFVLALTIQLFNSRYLRYLIGRF